MRFTVMLAVVSALMAFGHGGMEWTRSGGGSLGFGVGAAIGAKVAVGRDRPVVLHLGDGALGYSSSGFWTIRYGNPSSNTAARITGCDVTGAVPTGNDRGP